MTEPGAMEDLRRGMSGGDVHPGPSVNRSERVIPAAPRVPLSSFNLGA